MQSLSLPSPLTVYYRHLLRVTILLNWQYDVSNKHEQHVMSCHVMSCHVIALQYLDNTHNASLRFNLFHSQGEMSKLHAVREDVKLRIAEVRDDVMKEPTLSIGEKKEVHCTRQLPYSPLPLLLLLHYMLSCLAPITLCHASSCCSTVHLCLSFWWIWMSS